MTKDILVNARHELQSAIVSKDEARLKATVSFSLGIIYSDKTDTFSKYDTITVQQRVVNAAGKDLNEIAERTLSKLAILAGK